MLTITSLFNDLCLMWYKSINCLQFWVFINNHLSMVWLNDRSQTVNYCYARGEISCEHIGWSNKAQKWIHNYFISVNKNEPEFKLRALVPFSVLITVLLSPCCPRTIFYFLHPIMTDCKKMYKYQYKEKLQPPHWLIFKFIFSISFLLLKLLTLC